MAISGRAVGRDLSAVRNRRNPPLKRAAMIAPAEFQLAISTIIWLKAEPALAERHVAARGERGSGTRDTRDRVGNGRIGARGARRLSRAAGADRETKRLSF